VHGVDLDDILWPGHQPAGVEIVPRHQQIVVGTLRSILRQAGLTVEQFLRLSD